MKLQLLKAGEQRLADAITNNQPIRIGYFRIGTEAAFTPGEGGISQLGPLVYQGDSSNIAYFSASHDEANFFLELAHDAGAYTVGNVMIYLEDNTPLLWGALDKASVKSTSALTQKQVGIQLTLVCTFWFPKLMDALNVDNLTHRVVVLPRLADERSLMDVRHAEHPVYTLDTHTGFAAPVIAMKNLHDDRWWGVPHLAHESDPTLNGVDGGTAGEGYGSRQDTHHSAGFYQGFTQDVLMDGGDNWAAPTSGTINVDSGEYR